MWTETITIRLGTRFEAQADLVWVVFQQKFDLNAEKYCRHNDNGGKEVCELLSLIVICAMLLIQLFFTNTIQRFLLLVQRILAKSSTVFINYIAAGKIGGYIVAQTAIAVAQLALKHWETKNLLFNASSYLLLHRWTVRERMIRLART